MDSVELAAVKPEIKNTNLTFLNIKAAYTNNEINSKKKRQPIRIFSCSWDAHSRIDDLSICPPHIILYLFRLLAIPYS